MTTNRSARRAQGGFTLVELVVVIAILGILAAVALPRFTNLQREARVAKMQAVAGAVRAAAAQVKATAIVRGATCTTAAVAAGSSPVVLEGTGIALVACYPEASAAGIQAAANLTDTNDGLVFTYPSGGGALIAQNNGSGAALANCVVTYTHPTAADGQPTVTVTTTGC